MSYNNNNDNSSIFVAIVLWISFIAAAVAVIKEVRADSIEIIMSSNHYASDYYWTDDAAGNYSIKHELNESNPGLAYVHNSGINVGIYKNSYYKTSVYAGYSVETNWKYINFGVLGGIITGYEFPTGQKVLPMGQSYMLVGPKFAQAKIGAIPGAITFSLRIPL